MLHELLLSLTGISSPLLSREKGDTALLSDGPDRNISPPEQAIIAELAELGRVHSAVKNAMSAVETRSRSPICKAVSSSIMKKHLAAFRKRIVDVESSILSKDAAFVGGYEIVPLSTVVTEFAPWTHRFEWLLKLGHFMSGGLDREGTAGCSGASLLDYLDTQRHTGYTDIESMASDLLVTAQATWMRSVSAWLLYGRCPEFGYDDFMIKQSTSADAMDLCTLRQYLMPKFVTTTCADNILNTGNALNQIRRQKKARSMSDSVDIAMRLLPDQVALLKGMDLPINPAELESTTNKMNMLISRNALAQLLPMEKILDLFSMINSYVLLERGEFAVALINNTESLLNRRETQPSAHVRKAGRLDSLTIKDSELASILNKTWADLSSLQSVHESEDEAFTSAMAILKLSMFDSSQDSIENTLVATLTPVPALLRMDVPVTSPVNILLADSQLTTYAHINAHLLSIHRSQLRLADLWKLTSHRRCHPNPLAPPLSGSEYGRRLTTQRRQREERRSREIRRHWSSMSKTLFFVNELRSYMQGEVIHQSWSHFEVWLRRGPQSKVEVKSISDANHFEDAKADMEEQPQLLKTSTATQSDKLPHDPRSIAKAHRQYLTALSTALFVNKPAFNQSLQALLTLADHFIALFSRLQTVWQGLDLQEDDGIVDAFMNYAKDEKDILSEMNRSRDELEEILRTTVQCLKDIEHENSMSNLNIGIVNVGLSSGTDGEFSPWRSRTLDRFIMKLDFLQSSGGDEGNDLLDET